MTGEELRNKLKTIKIDGKKIVLKDLADKLNISPQLLNKRLEVQDIGTGFLQNIADALNIPIGLLLIDTGTSIISEAEHEYSNKKVQQLQAELKEAKEIIYQLNMELLKLKMSK